MYRVNYNEIAPDYDQRFVSAELEDRGKALLALAESLGAKRILEVGCGTAHWLSALHPLTPHLVGLDLSVGMLRQAQTRATPLELVQGSAQQLPFGDKRFDLVYCVDALHHFADPAEFIANAYAVLDRGGTFAIIGMDPRNPDDAWYAYDFFDGLYATDLKRFPSQATLLGWMRAAGFENIVVQQVERVDDPKLGRAVLNDPYLKKNSCSQLALLSEAEYAEGIDKIVAALAAAEARGETLVFRSALSIGMIKGRTSKLSTVAPPNRRL